ncbi:Cmx/CmrA family chloramphenicol efflux MFS transporter [Cellulomonas sp. P4]|uniref:Cmx/CmrA family chloramphenicol efflux MFS transporter n=1 Tax=Cellulomonas sp. P4 TaxID=3142533 RepID=UPI0031BA20BE
MPALLRLLAVAVFAQGTSEFVLAGLLPGIATDLGVPLARAGLLTSGFALGMVLGAPVMAAAARRLAPRWALSGFLAVFIAAHVLGAGTGSFALLLTSRVVAAAANAGFLAVTLSTVTRVVPAGRRTRALAVVLGGTTLALVAGVPAGALVGDLLGWRATLGAIALLCLPPLVAVLVAAPARPAADAGTGAAGTIGRELASLRARPVRLDLALTALVNGATFGSFTYLAAVAAGPAGLTGGALPALLAVFGVGAFLGVTLAGRIGDRHGRRLITVTGPALVAGWALLAWAADAPVALRVLTPVQGALSFALGSTLVARVVATADAPTMGGSFATAALNVGAVVGPVGAGPALDAAGAAGPFAVSAALVLTAVGLWGVVTVRARRASRAARGAAAGRPGGRPALRAAPDTTEPRREALPPGLSGRADRI